MTSDVLGVFLTYLTSVSKKPGQTIVLHCITTVVCPGFFETDVTYPTLYYISLFCKLRRGLTYLPRERSHMMSDFLVGRSSCI